MHVVMPVVRGPISIAHAKLVRVVLVLCTHSWAPLPGPVVIAYILYVSSDQAPTYLLFTREQWSRSFRATLIERMVRCASKYTAVASRGRCTSWFTRPAYNVTTFP